MDGYDSILLGKIKSTTCFILIIQWGLHFNSWLNVDINNFKCAVLSLWLCRNQDLSHFVLFKMKHLLMMIYVWCFPGSRGLYEQLWKKISLRSRQVSLSQWTHQSVNTQGTDQRFQWCLDILRTFIDLFVLFLLVIVAADKTASKTVCKLLHQWR